MQITTGFDELVAVHEGFAGHSGLLQFTLNGSKYRSLYYGVTRREQYAEPLLSIVWKLLQLPRNSLDLANSSSLLLVLH